MSTTHPTRRDLLAGLAAAGASAVLAQAGRGSQAAQAGPTTRPKQPKRPNIVVFYCDDLSEESLSCFGGDTHTPNLDRLAQQGMMLHNMNVTSSVCCPSRYSALTGRYAGRCEGPEFMRDCPPGTMAKVELNTELEVPGKTDYTTLPQVLKDGGYFTGCVGKWHLSDFADLEQRPVWEAADQWQHYAQDADPRDPEVSAKMRHNHKWLCDRVKAYGFDFADSIYAYNLRELYNDALYVHNPEWTMRGAQRFLNEASRAEEPFYLWFAPTLNHGPGPTWVRNGELAYGLDADPHMTGEGYVENPPDGGMPGREKIKQSALDAGKSLASAGYTQLDAMVGAMMRKLELFGMAEDTIFVFMSDHGERFNAKTTMYEGGIRVPAIVRYPAAVAAGSRTDELMSNVDLAATFLDYAGLQAPESLPQDGKTLRGLWEGGKEPVHEEIYAECGWARGLKEKDFKLVTVRYPADVEARIAAGETFRGWQNEVLNVPYYTTNSHLGHFANKGSPNYFDRDQLYDLRNDPDERTNLYDRAEYREIQDRLEAKLRVKLASFPNRPYPGYVE